MSAPDKSESSVNYLTRAPFWLAAGLALVLLLLTHPYEGLHDDALLYLGDVLRRSHPALNADLYFAHGSQGKYSIYAGLMAPLYQVLSIDVLQLLMLGIATAASMAAAYRLLRELGCSAAWLGVFCLLALNRSYGGLGLLSFSEQFLTARTLAEPLVLWGLVFVQEGRRLPAAVSLLLAAALHPLIALPGWVIAWLELQAADKRWRWALLSVPAVLVLALSGVAPFSGLFRRYDATWWELVKTIDPLALYSQWEWTDWQRTLVDFAMLALASCWAPPRLAALCRSSCWATVGLLMLSAVGGDWAHSQLITSLQLWRVLWLVHLLALACLPFVLGTLWQRERQLGLWRLATFLFAAAMAAADAGRMQGWVMLLAGGLVMGTAHRQLRVSHLVPSFAALGAVLCMLGIGAATAFTADAVWRSGYYDALGTPLWILLLGEPVICLPLAYAVVRIWSERRRARAFVLLGLVLVLVGTASQWDRRSDWIKLEEQGGLQRDHPFDRIIPPNAQVYWHQELVATWLLLGRPSYFGNGQGAGLLFNEGTARAYAPRWDQFKPIMDSELNCRIFSALTKRPEAQCITPSRETVRVLCGKQTRLDYLVFREPLDAPDTAGPAPLSSWNPHLPSHPELTFYLYACAQFR